MGSPLAASLIRSRVVGSCRWQWNLSSKPGKAHASPARSAVLPPSIRPVPRRPHRPLSFSRINRERGLDRPVTAGYQASLTRTTAGATTISGRTAPLAPMGSPRGSCVSRLVVDFDSTCTQRDTTALYGELAAEEAEARNDLERGAAIRQAWKEAGLAYMEQYDKAMALALQEAPQRREAFDLPALRRFLAAMSVMEQASMDDLVRNKLLAGVSRPAIADAVRAGRVPLQEGCLRVLHRCAHDKIAVSVLSVNPSRELLSAALHLDAWPAVTPPPEILSNELEQQGEVSTGALSGGIHTPLHKEACFERLASAAAPPGASPPSARKPAESQGLTVYVGDSVTDLLPLVSADLGVLLGCSASAERVCRAFGVTLQAVPEFLAQHQDRPVESRRGTGRLLQAQSWSRRRQGRRP
ncbi:hypothetical protein KFL_000010785 [Klebsormidium nitens]|uniref:Uncharacterized protein n=1 Tax=Klebsormidium nitens TaxID=105231 RepID=A0A0U9HI46_KLENI|nr:hypothetical protein KFL_000010785 [Klebsormidium nitens]|eukprot:GAQ77630.1 hypothetical protein KFL_000010785 [Klebsormidium nitens]